MAARGSNLETYGHSADDPMCELQWIPSSPTGVGPWPACILIHPGGFSAGGPGGLTQASAIALNAAGFQTFSITYRLTQMKLAGQTTSGLWPQQTSDCKVAVLAARADSRCDGRVVGLGGSAGGTHIASLCVETAPSTTEPWTADDRLLGAVSLSGMYDFANRDPVSYDPHLIAHIADKMAQYTGTSDLVQQALKAVTHFVTSDARPLSLFCTEMDPMPLPQIGAMVAALTRVGAQNFVSEVLAGSNLHAFAYWNSPASGGMKVSEKAVAFLLSVLDGTITPPPPPPNDYGLLPYTLKITGGPATYTQSIPADQAITTVEVTDLDPDTVYSVSVRANSIYGSSYPITGRFLSDTAGATGGGGGGGGGGPTGKGPSGVFDLLDASAHADSGDPTSNTLWTLPALAGAIYTTRWSIVEPSEGTYDWSHVDTFMALCATNGKKGAIRLIPGYDTPTWVYAAGAAKMTIGGGSYPPPWDHIFLAKWKALVTAFAAKYASHPNISYVNICGLGFGVDTRLGGNTTELDPINANAIANGFANLGDAWVAAAGQIIPLFQIKFKPPVATVLSITPPIPRDDTYYVGGGDMMLSAMITSLLGKLKPNFGLEAVINASSDVTDGEIGLVASYYSKFVTGFQMQYPASNPLLDPHLSPYVAKTGLLDAGKNAVFLHANFVEVFNVDAVNVDYQDTLLTIGNQLRTIAGGGGGRRAAKA